MSFEGRRTRQYVQNKEWFSRDSKNESISQRMCINRWLHFTLKVGVLIGVLQNSIMGYLSSCHGNV